MAIKRRRELDTIEFDNPLLSAAADPRFLALTGVPTTMKDAIVEDMVTACKRVKQHSFLQSSARQRSATCGAMSMLLDSDEEVNNEESQETKEAMLKWTLRPTLQRSHHPRTVALWSGGKRTVSTFPEWLKWPDTC